MIEKWNLIDEFMDENNLKVEVPGKKTMAQIYDGKTNDIIADKYKKLIKLTENYF